MNPSKADSRPPRAFTMASLGCKVNQTEAAQLAGELEDMGLGRAEEEGPCQVAVVFTCSVTASAARQSRQMARRLAARHPEALVVATGCDAQVSPRAYAQAGFTVIGRNALPILATAIAKGQTASLAGAPDPPSQETFYPGVFPPGPGRSRAFLKVQDGCDAFCAYCIVPHARGGPRSLPVERARDYFARLGQAGAAEVVLTGIHLGKYGRDLAGDADLAGLVRALLAAHSGPRIRLSSMEVNEISPGIRKLLATEPRLCPHLHIPLQSGSDPVLQAMGRPYSVRDFEKAVADLARELPGVCLGADVLMGLPGEDQTAFMETRALIQRLPLSYLHVFPYSPRPGTPAASLPARPPGPEVKKRAGELRQLGREKLHQFLAGQTGRVLEAVVEQGGLGRTGNYCLVKLANAPAPGSLLRVRALGVVQTKKGPGLAVESA